MKRTALGCLVLILASLPAFAELPPPPTDLSPWPMTENPGDPGEASAAGWIDAPAARLGPIGVKDGHFYSGPNRVKFWGVNLAFGANFPTHAEADRLAVRFRNFGINAVRFHHMDNQPYPNGIFADSSLVNMSPEALDRLDYFITVLKAQGIYADLNLHVSRNYRNYHRPAGGGDGPAVDKIVDLFDPTLIAAQKQYAHDLLTHVNAYTHNAYAVEPAVGIVEINNENSLFMWGAPQTIADLPQPYAGELKRQWNAWLLAKYHDDAALKKTWGVGEEPIGKAVSEDPTFLTAGKNGRHVWEAEVHQPAAMTVSPISGSGVNVEASAVDGIDWHLQYKQGGLHLKTNSAYVVRLVVHADHPVVVGVAVGQNHGPWQTLGLGSNASLTTEDQTIELPFTATGDDANARLSLSLGHEKATITLSSVELLPGGRTGLPVDQSAVGGSVQIITPKVNPTANRRGDWTTFLIDTERKYYGDMRSFLRSELNVRCPITGTIGFGSDGVKAQSNMDFVDGHAYWQHPSFPHKQWDTADWRIDNRPMVDVPNASVFPGLEQLRDPKRPFTVTEYQHPAPNDWRAEGIPMIATNAARRDWDGVFIFAYSHNTDYAKQKISSFFDIEGDPVKMAMMPAAARLFFGQLHAPVLGSKSGGPERIKSWDARGGLPGEWNSTGAGAGQMIARDDRAGVFIGFGPSLGADLGIAKLDSLETPFAAIVVQMQHPHDDNAVLVTAVARAENTGMQWDAKRTTVGNHWGTTPVLIATVKATSSLAGDWKHAHPLDPAGNALPDEVGSAGNGRFVVKLGGRPAVAYIVTK
jgi:hypothetical protein